MTTLFIGNYYAVLKHYTNHGYRVIALAAKTLNPHLTWTRIQQISRDKVEANPELVGLLGRLLACALSGCGDFGSRLFVLFIRGKVLLVSCALHFW